MSQIIQNSSSSKFTTSQWVLILIFTVINFNGGLIYSVLSAFYPAEATKKGVPATEYGFVFGVYELTNFILAPIFGVHMSKLGAKTTLLSGILLMSIMTILFSFVDQLDGRTLFVSVSFLLRIPQAVGATAIMTASFTIVAIEFPHSVSTIFSIIETVFAFGTCIGPTIGAALFEIGGFPMTFLTLGIFTLLMTPVSFFSLWNKSISASSLCLDTGTKKGVIDLMRLAPVSLVIIANVLNLTCTGLFTVLLEPYLRQFEIGPFGTGLMFLLYGIAYASSAPVWGILCDKVSQPFYVMLGGTIFFLVGFLLIGPAPFIPLEPILWMTALGLVFAGIGSGAVSISSFTIMMQKARANGFPDSLGTYSLVSGIWTSSYALGAFLGPSLAGVLYDAIGFRDETCVILAIQLVVMITLVLYIKFGEGKVNDTKRSSSATATVAETPGNGSTLEMPSLQLSANGNAKPDPIELHVSQV